MNFWVQFFSTRFFGPSIYGWNIKKVLIIIIFSLSVSKRKKCHANNFNVAHYSKGIKDINTKLGILAHLEKVQLQDKGHNPESYVLSIIEMKSFEIIAELKILVFLCFFKNW